MYQVTATYVPKEKRKGGSVVMTKTAEFKFRVDAGTSVEAVTVVQNSGFFCGDLRENFGFLAEVIRVATTT